MDEEYWRLDIAAIVGVEDEARPTHVDAILEQAARVRVHRDPRLVVERRGRGGLVDERWRAPGQVAASVERSLVNRHGVRRAGAIEAKSAVVNIALTVEGDRRISTRIILTCDQMFNAGDLCPDLGRISCWDVI